MPKHKFVIILRKDRVLHGEGRSHEETLMIDEEYCWDIELRREGHEPLFILKGSYVTNSLIPYFDLLHDYKIIDVISRDVDGKPWVNTYARGIFI